MAFDRAVPDRLAGLCRTEVFHLLSDHGVGAKIQGNMRATHKVERMNAVALQGRSIAIKRSNICIAIGLSLTGASCFAQQNPPSRGRDVTKLYAEYCAGCHGADTTGGSGPSLVDGAWRRGGDDSIIAASIRIGYPHEGMPAIGNSFDAPEIRGC